METNLQKIRTIISELHDGSLQTYRHRTSRLFKRSVFSVAKQFLFRLGFFCGRVSSCQQVTAFFELLQDNFRSIPLRRFGPVNDGGYLVPECLERVDYLFSPGVDDVYTFEKEISDYYGATILMIDGSVDAPDGMPEYFCFEKKFLSSINSERDLTLETWVENKAGATAKRLLLQMDVEGSEFEILLSTPDRLLKKFDAMVIEFHGLDRLLDSQYHGLINNSFKKLLNHFYICHIHPNNNCGSINFKGKEVPLVMEVSFIRNNIADEKYPDAEKTLVVPNELDSPNVEGLKDFDWSKLWFTKP